LSFEGASFLEAGLVLIFLSSLAIAFPNADLSDRVDPSTEFHPTAIRPLWVDTPWRIEAIIAV
jgi:hypothetical protein